MNFEQNICHKLKKNHRSNQRKISKAVLQNESTISYFQTIFATCSARVLLHLKLTLRFEPNTFHSQSNELWVCLARFIILPFHNYCLSWNTLFLKIYALTNSIIILQKIYIYAFFILHANQLIELGKSIQ